MVKYSWESECDIQDVLSGFNALTDRPNVIDRSLFDYKYFKCKDFEPKGYHFILWFHYAWSRASYQPAPIKGTIIATSSGCRIEAYLQRWLTVVNSIFLFVLLAGFYAVSIAAHIAGFKGCVVVSIIFSFLATGILIRFLYTRKKWSSENALLNLIDNAANVKHQQQY